MSSILHADDKVIAIRPSNYVPSRRDYRCLANPFCLLDEKVTMKLILSMSHNKGFLLLHKLQFIQKQVLCAQYPSLQKGLQAHTYILREM